MIVVDAAAIIDVILPRPIAGKLLVRLFGTDEEVVAPYLIDSEVVHSLRRLTGKNLISVNHAEQALTLFHRLAITRIPNGDIVRRIWELRHNNSAYDATYVAIAEQLDVPLITRDKRLSNSSGHAARIEYIA